MPFGLADYPDGYVGAASKLRRLAWDVLRLAANSLPHRLRSVAPASMGEVCRTRDSSAIEPLPRRSIGGDDHHELGTPRSAQSSSRPFGRSGALAGTTVPARLPHWQRTPAPQCHTGWRALDTAKREQAHAQAKCMQKARKSKMHAVARWAAATAASMPRRLQSILGVCCTHHRKTDCKRFEPASASNRIDIALALALATRPLEHCARCATHAVQYTKRPKA